METEKIASPCEVQARDIRALFAEEQTLDQQHLVDAVAVLKPRGEMTHARTQMGPQPLNCEGSCSSRAPFRAGRLWGRRRADGSGK